MPKIEWGEVIVGALVTATLFIIGNLLIGFYLSHSTAASPYGVAGALALLLLWTYYSAMIFLFGVELTEVWAEQHRPVIRAKRGGVRESDSERRVA